MQDTGRSGWTPVQLGRKGVVKVGMDIEIRDPTVAAEAGAQVLSWLRCRACHRTWAILTKPAGDWGRGFWKCPNGCNHR
jgi:hypothetical protein